MFKLIWRFDNLHYWIAVRTIGHPSSHGKVELLLDISSNGLTWNRSLATSSLKSLAIHARLVARLRVTPFLLPNYL